MSRAYHGRSDDHASFILIILGVSIVWSHRAAVARVELVLPIVLITFVSMVGLFIVAKLGFKIMKYLCSPNSIMAKIDCMTGLEFEQYVAKVLKMQGYDHIRLTEYYDLGVDIVANKNGIRWGIQVKCYSGLVKADAVRQVVTALRSYNCDRAMVVTNSSFSHTATRLAESNRCLLVDRKELLRWTDKG